MLLSSASTACSIRATATYTGLAAPGGTSATQCYQVTNIEQVNAGYWDIRKQYMVVQPWVLVLPRESIDTCVSFTPWRRVQHRLVEFTKDATWLRRPLAEWSHSHVQVIPCAVVRNTSGEFFAVRRVRSTRTDISDRLSLVFGGHVDYEDIREDFPKTIACTLRRELLEETGVKSPRNSPDPDRTPGGWILSSGITSRRLPAPGRGRRSCTPWL